MPAGVNAALTGNSPLLADLLRVEERDLALAELVGLPIAFIILMLALRSLVAALLPLGLACAAGPASETGWVRRASTWS